MPQLWFKQEDSEWLQTAFVSTVQLEPNGLAPLAPDAAPTRAPTLVRHRPPGMNPVWLIVAPLEKDIYVNGERLTTGIRALEDRDAIRFAGQREPFYFSTERLAAIEPFPDEPGIYCARCKLEIEAGLPAVQCPTCRVWMHESQADERCCFSYGETCALCDQPTDLDDPRFRWTPEEL